MLPILMAGIMSAAAKGGGQSSPNGIAMEPQSSSFQRYMQSRVKKRMAGLGLPQQQQSVYGMGNAGSAPIYR